MADQFSEATPPAGDGLGAAAGVEAANRPRGAFYAFPISAVTACDSIWTVLQSSLLEQERPGRGCWCGLQADDHCHPGASCAAFPAHDPGIGLARHRTISEPASEPLTPPSMRSPYPPSPAGCGGRKRSRRWLLTGLVPCCLLLPKPCLTARFEAQQRAGCGSVPIPDQKTGNPSTVSTRCWPRARRAGLGREPVRLTLAVDRFYTAAVSAFPRGDLDLCLVRPAFTGVSGRLQETARQGDRPSVTLTLRFKSLFIATPPDREFTSLDLGAHQKGWLIRLQLENAFFHLLARRAPHTSPPKAGPDCPVTLGVSARRGSESLRPLAVGGAGLFSGQKPSTPST